MQQNKTVPLTLRSQAAHTSLLKRLLKGEGGRSRMAVSPTAAVAPAATPRALSTSTSASGNEYFACAESRGNTYRSLRFHPGLKLKMPAPGVLYGLVSRL